MGGQNKSFSVNFDLYTRRAHFITTEPRVIKYLYKFVRINFLFLFFGLVYKYFFFLHSSAFRPFDIGRGFENKRVIHAPASRTVFHRRRRLMGGARHGLNTSETRRARGHNNVIRRGG